jgi:hypothetical protein
MLDQRLIQKQLDHIGVRLSYFGHAEVKELPAILMDNEVIEQFIVGRYSGGFAVLCATNLRLLLIDKKFLFLTIEDIRYDMIAELDYGYRLIGATLHIRSFSKDLQFQSFKKQQLRHFTSYVQQKVMDARQQQQPATDSPPPPRILKTKPSSLGAMVIQSLAPIIEVQEQLSKAPSLILNPHSRTPLLTRRRVGRYGAPFAKNYM